MPDDLSALHVRREQIFVHRAIERPLRLFIEINERAQHKHYIGGQSSLEV
ncbi:hypothetical protein [Burkholderia ubonensis]|nr:hypothetical protein [Burkholderia ubonensis]